MTEEHLTTQEDASDAEVAEDNAWAAEFGRLLLAANPDLLAALGLDDLEPLTGPVGAPEARTPAPLPPASATSTGTSHTGTPRATAQDATLAAAGLGTQVARDSGTERTARFQRPVPRPHTAAGGSDDEA